MHAASPTKSEIVKDFTVPATATTEAKRVTPKDAPDALVQESRSQYFKKIDACTNSVTEVRQHGDVGWQRITYIN